MSGDMGEANTFYEKVLSYEPNHIAALINLGKINYRLGKYKISQSYIKRALKQDLSQTQSDDLNKLLKELSTYSANWRIKKKNWNNFKKHQRTSGWEQICIKALGEWLFPKIIGKLPLRLHGWIDKDLWVHAQWSKKNQIPKDYIALTGGLCAVGAGDLLNQVLGNLEVSSSTKVNEIAKKTCHT